MDFGLGSLIEKIEEYFGKRMTSLLLFLLFLVVFLWAVEEIFVKILDLYDYTLNLGGVKGVMTSYLLTLLIVMVAFAIFLAIRKFIVKLKKAKAAANQEQIVSEIKETFDLDARPWPVNPAAGRNVARQIMKAETVQEARAFFEDHLVAPSPKDSDWAVTAILHRLHEGGSEDEFMDLSMELYEDGIDISSPPYIEEELGIRKR